MEVIHDPRGVVVVPWCCARGADYSGDLGTATGGSYSSATTQTENITHFQRRAVSKCTVRMLSGWVLAIE